VNIDTELRDVLRRKDPPAGFADRVVRRLSVAPAILPARPFGFAQGRHWKLRALAAAALLAFALGGLGVHAAVRAKNEVLTAMRIASHKVADAQRAVNRR
jgi:hypothetical protein